MSAADIVANPRLHLMRRELPGARRRRSEALNAASPPQPGPDPAPSRKNGSP